MKEKEKLPRHGHQEYFCHEVSSKQSSEDENHVQVTAEI